MFSPSNQHTSKDDYLLIEEKSDDKYELHNGMILAMSGGTLNHSLIAVKIIAALHNELNGSPCQVFNGDLKVEASYSYLYPDAMVICGEIEMAESRKDIVKNPILIFEILSPSTEQFDRGEKFAKYRQLDSFKEYVLVSQHTNLVEIFYKEDHSHYFMTIVTDLNDKVYLKSMDIYLSLKDIYDRIEF